MTENITREVPSACSTTRDVACCPPKAVAGPSQFNSDVNSVLRTKGEITNPPRVVVPRVLRAMSRLMGRCYVPTSVRLPLGNGSHSGRLRPVSAFHLDRGGSPNPECLSMIRGRGSISHALLPPSPAILTVVALVGGGIQRTRLPPTFATRHCADKGTSLRLDYIRKTKTFWDQHTN